MAFPNNLSNLNRENFELILEISAKILTLIGSQG